MMELAFYTVGYTPAFALGFYGIKAVRRGLNKWSHLLDPAIRTTNAMWINGKVLQLKLGPNEFVTHTRVCEVVQRRSDPVYFTPGKHISIPVGGDLYHEDKEIFHTFTSNIDRMYFNEAANYIRYSNYAKKSYDLSEAKTKLNSKFNIKLARYDLESNLIRIYTRKFVADDTLYMMGTNANDVCRVDCVSDDIECLANAKTQSEIFKGFALISGAAIIAFGWTYILMDIDGY